METAQRITDLSPDFVRMYPTLVLANSRLATWYEKGHYTPMSLATSVTLVKELYSLFQHHNIPVVRMGLQASADLNDPGTVLAGPYHPAFGHLVFSELFLDKATGAIATMKQPRDRISLAVHPENTSRLRGLKNQNIHILKERFRIESLAITSDTTLSRHVVVATPEQTHLKTA